MRDQYARAEIERELEEGETIEWLGQPSPQSYALIGAPFCVFGIVWTAFAATFIYMAFSHPGSAPPIPFLLVPGLFMLLGFGMIAQPLVYFSKAKQICYAITNRRVLIITAGKTRSVDSITHVNPENISMTEKQDGSGTLMIKKPSQSANSNRSYAGVGFFGIPNVREAQAALHKTFGKGQPGKNQIRF